jgi:nicotinate phosphoribosyltransferase
VRQMLNQAGLHRLKIFASSSLNEYETDRLLSHNAPIDGFVVGTHMGTSSDAPFLDRAYKLVEYGGRPRLNLSTHKSVLPGRKQVFRDSGRDVIGLADERLPGRPPLSQVMKNGKRVSPPESLQACRTRCLASVGELKDGTQEVEISPLLQQLYSNLANADLTDVSG